METSIVAIFVRPDDSDESNQMVQIDPVSAADAARDYVCAGDEDRLAYDFGDTASPLPEDQAQRSIDTFKELARESYCP